MSPPAAAPAFPYDFDPAARAKARSYERGSRRIALFGGTLLPASFALAFWASGASRGLADASAAAAGSSALAGDVLFIVAFAALFAALTLPVAFYSGHLREKRWGMSHRKRRDFAKDSVKSVILGVLFGLALLLPFFYIVRRFAEWWLVAGALYALYLLFSTSVLPHLLLPIFYKVRPLPEGELRTSVLEVCSRAGVPPVREVAVMRESAKSPRANAFIHGVGRTRRIVLYDTLLTDFHPREVRFTVAHEVGHLAHRDVPRFFAIALALVLPEMWLLSRGLDVAGFWFGVRGPADPAVVPALLLVVALMGLLDGIAMSWLSRRSEAAADAFALSTTNDPVAAESMMKRLCDRNLIDESPSPLLERLVYSHPAPARRIEAARAFGQSAASREGARASLPSP